MNEPSVNATPVKSFFVEMLTRDISLDDAILDLMDNSVDGVMRSIGKKSLMGEKMPYAGYWVKIRIDKNQFSIEDNCGGIPYRVLVDYAFRMGRDPKFKDKPVPTVGTFGIGMKRAIFKMGRSCSVLTHTGGSGSDRNNKWHTVKIDPGWVSNDERWDIPLYSTPDGDGLSSPGTKITIGNLTEMTTREFTGSRPPIRDRLMRNISETYALIIAKGFDVYVNDEKINPRPMQLMLNNTVRPYCYFKEDGAVRVQMMVGLTGPLQTEEERERGDSARDSSANAGWTVVCNDRVVLYCDKTTQTGWGELPVPKFHNQFIKIAGVVYFECEDARLLPTTTTKRGIDANNRLYQEIKNMMREGTKKFTDFTNKWKQNESEIRSQLEAIPLVPISEIKNQLMNQINQRPKEKAKIASSGVVFSAKYPIPPKKTKPKNRFTVIVNEQHIPAVAEYLCLTDYTPEMTIERAFDYVYRKGVRQ